MSLSDRELVDRCLSGDETSLRIFVERFHHIICSVCYRMLGHHQDAEDVTQEVFLRAFRHLHGWKPDRPLRPWLMAITANRCRTFLTERAKRPHLTEFTAKLPAADPGDSDLAEELQLALSQVRDTYRMCFILYYQQELSCAEIGHILKCPTGTVKTWLYRVRRELADHLKRRGIGHELQRV